MSQISRKVDPLRSNWHGLCVFTSNSFAIYCCELINPRKVRICLFDARKTFSNTVAVSIDSLAVSSKLFQTC